MGDHADDARDLEARMRLKRMEEADEAALAAAAKPLVEHPAFPGLMMKDSAQPTAIVGIPYPNPDGSSRKDRAAACEDGTLLMLVREPDNLYDRNLETGTSNAVAAYAANGFWPDKLTYDVSDQVGYIPAGLAAYYQPLMDNDGLQVFAVVVGKGYNKHGALSSLQVLLGVLAEEVKDNDGSPMAPSCGGAL